MPSKSLKKGAKGTGQMSSVLVGLAMVVFGVAVSWVALLENASTSAGLHIIAAASEQVGKHTIACS